MSVITDLIDENSALHRRVDELESTIDRLESQINRSIQANYDLRAELDALKAQEPVAQKPSDSLIEQALMNFGGKWDGDRWTIEDADLHQFVHSFAAPVVSAEQQGVADVSAMARVLADRNADACNVNREDNWAIYGQDYIDDVRAMLAAPAPSTTEGQGDE